ncbi:MAG TPA: hypothetical protein DIU00_00540 [Phycisphaerales bacterium]|nr:hypothetical protein [Phycisphaerales bacterium]
MSNTKKTITKKAITKQTNIKKANTRKIDTTKANIKKTSPRKIDTTKANIKKTIPKKANIRQVSTRKANTSKVDHKKIHESVAEITEIALLLLAFGIVAEILFGGLFPIGNRIMMNLVGSLGTLGENGFAGLVALGIVVYIFRRGKVFA